MNWHDHALTNGGRVEDWSDEELLDVDAVAKHFGIEKRSVHRKVEKGEIPAPVMYGGLPRWRRGLLREFHRACEVLDRLRRVDFKGPGETGATEEETSRDRGSLGTGKTEKRR